MTNRNSSTAAGLARREMRKLRVDEALQELERAQTIFNESNRRQVECSTEPDEIGLKAKPSK
jgi:hypothetical protein